MLKAVADQDALVIGYGDLARVKARSSIDEEVENALANQLLLFVKIH